jgi:putative transposase
VPWLIVTDKLRSYGVAQSQLLPGVEHRQSPYLNKRPENSDLPTRRERQVQRFRSSERAQDFLAHSFIYGHFRPHRHGLAANTYRAIRLDAFKIWHHIAVVGTLICESGVWGHMFRTLDLSANPLGTRG